MNLQLATDHCSHHLNQIAKVFKPGVKLTLIGRTPGNGEADLVLTNDQIPEAIKALERRQAAVTVAPDPEEVLP